MPGAELNRLQRHPLVQQLVQSMSERPGRAVDVDVEVRRAAVLLTLRSREDGDLELLMIKRSDFEGDPWSGHIAFPGGRMEPEDRDLAVTALRETWEETGVDVAADGRVLGYLDELCPRNPHLPLLVIRPYVALVRADVRIVPSREVADAFWVPLSSLRTADAWGTSTVSVRDQDRTVNVFRHGRHMVWGLTERVLRQFLEYVEQPRGRER